MAESSPGFAGYQKNLRIEMNERFFFVVRNTAGEKGKKEKVGKEYLLEALFSCLIYKNVYLWTYNDLLKKKFEHSARLWLCLKMWRKSRIGENINRKQ